MAESGQTGKHVVVPRANEVADTEFGGLPQTEFLAWTATDANARVLALAGSADDARLVLEELTRVLADGGRLLIVDYKPEASGKPARRLSSELLTHSSASRNDFSSANALMTERFFGVATWFFPLNATDA